METIEHSMSFAQSSSKLFAPKLIATSSSPLLKNLRHSSGYMRKLHQSNSVLRDKLKLLNSKLSNKIENSFKKSVSSKVFIRKIETVDDLNAKIERFK